MSQANGNTPRTTSWTADQKRRVDSWVRATADECCKGIKTIAPSLEALDKRLHQSWTKEQPDVYFPYVQQGILEDLIAELQERV